jgi:hypothetical protein
LVRSFLAGLVASPHEICSIDISSLIKRAKDIPKLVVRRRNSAASTLFHIGAGTARLCTECEAAKEASFQVI